jgi:hypothetical protein
MIGFPIVPKDVDLSLGRGPLVTRVVPIRLRPTSTAATTATTAALLWRLCTTSPTRATASRLLLLLIILLAMFIYCLFILFLRAVRNFMTISATVPAPLQLLEVVEAFLRDIPTTRGSSECTMVSES